MRAHDRLYIGGEWVASTGDGSIPVVNPATEDVIATVPDGTAEDADRAVRAARLAFAAWAATPVEERARLLAALRDGLARRQAELAATITAEMGAPARVASSVQTGLPLQVLDTYIALAGTAEETETIGNSLVVREPVGVVAAITPWNYPLHQSIAKIAPALLAGCTVVHKPSEVAPLSAQVIAEVAARGRASRRRVQPALRDRRRPSARHWPGTRTSTWCPSPARRAPGGGSARSPPRPSSGSPSSSAGSRPTSSSTTPTSRRR